MVIVDPVSGKESEFDPTTIPGFGGSATCKSGDCSMVSLGSAEDGSFTADYGTNEALLAKSGIVASPDKTTTRARALRSGRRLQEGD
jgi:hypothetical protein